MNLDNIAWLGFGFCLATLLYWTQTKPKYLRTEVKKQVKRIKRGLT